MSGPWLKRSLSRLGQSKCSDSEWRKPRVVVKVQEQITHSRSDSLMDYTNAERVCFVLAKQDNETFGIEIQTYGLQPQNCLAEMCTFVSQVQENSPAKRVGLDRGDVIVSINGECCKGSTHQHIIDLIRKSRNLLTLETVRGTAVRRAELQKKLRLLKQTLRQKWAELHALTSEEERLARGSLGYPYPCSPMSLGMPTGQADDSFSSDSSCWSLMTEGSEDSHHLPCAFEEYGYLNSRDCPLQATTVLTSQSQTSLAGSSGSLSNIPGAFWPFGTLPRRAGRATLRKRIVKFIPGLNHSVEE